MDALISDLLRTTSYALGNQKSDATGMRASLEILHRRLLEAAATPPAEAEDVWSGGLAAIRVTSG